MVKRVSPTTQLHVATLNGLRQYIRLDLPNPNPEPSTPWVIFAHGWVGPKAAPQWRFNLGEGSYYGDLIERFRQAGFIVVFPGYRGHGTVDQIPADGIEYLDAFDNETRIVPFFYAQDLIATSMAMQARFQSPPLIFAHSQGADAALVAVILGQHLPAPQRFSPEAVSLWSGLIASRADQYKYFDAKQSGATERDFYTRVQRALSQFDMQPWTLEEAESWVLSLEPLRHQAELNTRMQIHYSDRDRYSPPHWNRALFDALRHREEHALEFYPDNTHEFELAPNARPTSLRGREHMLDRTITFYRKRSSHARSP